MEAPGVFTKLSTLAGTCEDCSCKCLSRKGWRKNGNICVGQRPQSEKGGCGALNPTFFFFFNPLCLEHFLELNKFLVFNLIYSCLETRVGVLMCLIQFYSKSIRSRYSSGVCAQEVCACVECACNHMQASKFLNANLRVCLGIYRLPIILLSPLMERCKYPYKSSSLLWRLCWQTSKQFLCRVWFSTLGIEPLRVELSGLVRNV